jgi:hypothetical protein
MMYEYCLHSTIDCGKRTRDLETYEFHQLKEGLSQQVLWETLENPPIEGWILNIIKELYRNNKDEIKQGKL